MTRRDQVLFALPLAVILLLFMIWPAVFGFIASFTDYAPAQPQTHFVGFENYAEIVQNGEFGTATGNVLVYTAVSVSAELMLGFSIAYLLREPFRGRGLLRVLLLIPWLISPVANGVLWHFLFSSESGLFSFLGAWLGLPAIPSPLGIPSLALPAAILGDIWRKTPFVSFLLLPGMLSLPTEQWEQATIEGASTSSRIRHIALPWLRPLLLTIALLLIGDALGTFDNILVMTGGGPGSTTMMPGLFSYQAAFTHNNWPIGATSAWLIVAAILVCGVAYLWLVRDGRARPSVPRRFRTDRLSLLCLPSLGLPGFGWRFQRALLGWGRAFLLSLLLLSFTLPLVWTVLASINIKPENAVTPPRWEVAISLDNYREVGATEPGFLQELWTSTVLALVTTLLTIMISFFAAYSLSRARVRAKNILVQSFLVLACLPVMAYAIPLNATMRYLHLYDTFAGVVLGEMGVFAPLASYILFGYLAQVTPELEQAARLEGANPIQLVWSVVLPVTAGGVVATALVIFVLSWNQFLVPFVLSTNQVRSIPMAMVDVFKWDRELEWSAVAAAIITSLLPLLILVAAAYRLLEQFRLTGTRQVT